MEKTNSGGLVASAQNILSLCNNEFNEPPPLLQCRIYMSEMFMSWKAFGKRKFNRKYIKYEIACRADDTNKDMQQTRETHLLGLLKRAHLGQTFSRVSISTPADYVEKLLRVEPKHTNKPCWEFCDFTGAVCMLGTWLGALSWSPSLQLSDLCCTDKIKLVPVTNLEDSASLANNAVFISQLVCGRPGSGAYWALVAACAAAGATVATDRALLAGPGTPRFISRGGHMLWRDILDALAVLAELYDRTNAGELFAYAFFKGIHTVNTVVSHSDEGGLNRDVLREGCFPRPYGGLPADCPLHAGMPTIADSAPYSSLCAIVDALCISSAAAIACCAPMVEMANGSVRPVVVNSSIAYDDLHTPEPTKGADDNDLAAKKLRHAAVLKTVRTSHVAEISGPLLDGYFRLAENYFPALSQLLGLAPTGQREMQARTWMAQAADSVLCNIDNRHLLKSNAIAPFFWVEPTTIFARGYFDYEADRAGWGTYGGGMQVLREPWMGGVEQVDRATAAWRYYEIDFEGARKSLWISALHNHKDDGLAQMHFKRLDPEALILPGPGVTTRGFTSSFISRSNLSEYLWKRGQSSLPHPAELLHLNDRVVIAVNHYKPAEDNWLAAVPSANELSDAVLECTFSAPVGLRVGEANAEARRGRAIRSRGLQALHVMVSKLQDSTDVTRGDGGYIMQAVPPRLPTLACKPQEKTGLRSTTVHAQVRGAESWNYVSRNVASKSEDSTVARKQAAPMPPTLYAGGHVGPRLPVAGPGGGGPSATSDGGEQSVPAGAQGGHGVAGAPGNPDGQGAAGMAPAPPC